jgi:hypothetical protein
LLLCVRVVLESYLTMGFSSRPRTALPSRTQVVARAGKFRPQSRIGKKPVSVPSGVTVTLKDNHLSVKVSLSQLAPPFMLQLASIAALQISSQTRNVQILFHRRISSWTYI